MKKVATTVGLLFALSQFAICENIDGTLAVDANVNKLTSTAKSSASSFKSSAKEVANKLSQDDTLSANLDNNVNTNYDVTAKDTVAADSAPIATSYDLVNSVEGPFVGLEGSAVIGSEADGKSSSGMSFGLRFGAQNSEWRTMAVLEKYSNDTEYNDYLRGLLQLDYYFLGNDNLMIDTFALRPYAGLNAGGLSLDTSKENVKTLTYGGQVGATMGVTSNIDLDVGYRYNVTTSDLVDHTSNLVVGVHYKY